MHESSLQPGEVNRAHFLIKSILHKVMVDIKRLLEPVSPESPCGEDLEYDSDFLDLFKKATYIPAKKMGNEEIPAVEPPWPEIHEKSLSLLLRSKDLRVLVVLSKALLCEKQFEGFAEGLGLVRSMLETYWTTLHPLPDPEDGDVTMRLSALSELGDYEFGVQRVSQIPLVSLRGLGAFGLDEMEKAKTTPQLHSEVEAAFLECDIGELTAREKNISVCVDNLFVIQNILLEKAEKITKLDDLSSLLKKAQTILADKISTRGGSVNEEPGNSNENAQPERPQASPQLSGVISSPEDVKRTLESICEYYSKNEPSSPIPLLLQRAKRLVSKNFMQILEDISPDGVKQVNVLKGPDSEG
ncbi:MAG: type VI secretion system protein TssA [Nitrospinota bacterium]